MCLSMSVLACVSTTVIDRKTLLHMREGEREWQSITGYIACCVVWKKFQKAAIKVAVENVLSAVILFIQNVSLPEAVYFKAFKVL